MSTLAGLRSENHFNESRLVKVYLFFGQYPIIGLLCWAISFTFLQGTGILEIISLVVGVIVGVLTILSKIQSFFERRERREMRNKLKKVLEDENNEITAENVERINELIDDTYE